MVAHEAVVPAVAPLLAQRTLRPAQEDFDGRVDLGRVELRRIKNPCQHLLAVHGLEPFRFGLVRLELAEDVVIFMGELGEATVFFVDSHEFGREFHGGVGCEQKVSGEAEDSAGTL